MKNTKKKTVPPPPASQVPPAQGALLSVPSTVAPITGAWLTVAQLQSLLPFPIDDALLRRLANPHNPSPATGRPYVPAARGGRWPHPGTIAGLCAYYATRAQATGELPATYDSMTHMANALSLDKKSIQWSLRNGAAQAQLTGSRVDPHIIIQHWGQTIEAIATGHYQKIGGLKEWDLKIELAQKVSEEKEALQRKAILEKGEMLFTRDGLAAIPELRADELLWDKILSPMRAAFVKHGPALIRQIKTIIRQHRATSASSIASAKEDAIMEKQITDLITSADADLLTRFRAKIPKAEPSPHLELEQKQAA